MNGENRVGSRLEDAMTEIDTSPYRRLREIGRGAYGKVYLASGPDGFVALKLCIRPDDGDAAPYFREQRALETYVAMPPIEGIVAIRKLVVVPDGKYFYYVMDLADDELRGQDIQPESYRPKTLAEVLEAEGALSLKASVALGLRLAQTLVALQKRHLAHRDIKPGNILMVRGRPVLADIGLLTDMRRDDLSAVGTKGYAPPEQHGLPSGDVFSLGQTLYRVSTGREIDEHGFAPTREADFDAPFFGRWLIIIEKACDPDPLRRYRSAKGLLKDLRALRRAMLFTPYLKSAGIFLAAAAIIGLAIWGTLKIRVRGALTRKEMIEKLLQEKALVLSRAAFATNLDETLAGNVDSKIVDKAVNGFWKDSTLYTEALVDIAFALRAPEGTDLVGEAEKILQVRLGAGMEAAIREEAHRICRYRIEFSQNAIEAFDLAGKEESGARDMLAVILIDAIHNGDFNRCCLDMEAARFLVDEALGKGTMGGRKKLRLNAEDVREYRRRCRAVQDAVLKERMNTAVSLTIRGAYADIGSPDFANRLVETFSRATEIPREEFVDRFAKLLEEGRLLLAKNLAQRYAQMLKAQGQAGKIEWPLSEEDVGRVVGAIARRTGIGEGQIRLAFDAACR